MVGAFLIEIIMFTDKLGVKESTPSWMTEVKSVLRLFLLHCNSCLKNPVVSYKNNLFLERYKVYLDGNEAFPEADSQPLEPSTSKARSENMGRPKVRESECTSSILIPLRHINFLFPTARFFNAEG